MVEISDKEIHMPRVLLIESKEKKDPSSEGLFLTHLFQMFDISYISCQANSRRSVIDILAKTPDNIEVVHLSTHGSIDSEILGFTTTKGKDVTIKDLKKAGITLDRRVFITTACQAGTESFAKDFLRCTKCDYYIGSKKDIHYEEAIYFSHIFYHQYFYLECKTHDAFKKAKEICGPKPSWQIYPFL